MSLQPGKFGAPKLMFVAGGLSCLSGAIWIATWFASHNPVWISIGAMFFAIGGMWVAIGAAALAKETKNKERGKT